LLLLAAAGGCSRPQSNRDFVPAEQTARAALEAALDAWVRGDTGRTVPGASPAIEVIDDRRAKNRPLVGYTVLGPVPADAPLCFAVQLRLGGPAEEVRERYVVVGLDPLWVWRHDDYVMVTHWSHPMPGKR
jgi:hypothetical protein